LHGPVTEGHVHVDGAVLAGKGSLDLQAFALGRRQPFQFGWNVKGGSSGAAQSKDISKERVG